MSQQLNLKFDIQEVEKPTCRQYRTPDQGEKFQRVLEELRKEKAKWMEIVNELFPGKYQSPSQLPTAEIHQVSEIYYSRNPRPVAVETQSYPRLPSKPPKPYKPWTYERKLNARIRKLIKRLQKKYSLRVDQYFEEMQDHILKQPQYFGVCPLPGSLDSCPISFAEERKRVAMQKKIELRNQWH